MKEYKEGHKSKVCTKCDKRKKLNLFAKTKNKDYVDGYTYWCKTCISEYTIERNLRLYGTKYNPNFRYDYRKRHPERWTKYQTSYMEAYLKSPIVKLRQSISRFISEQKWEKKSKCEECGNKAKTKWYFELEFINKIIKLKKKLGSYRILANNEKMLKENVKCLCNDCLYNKRMKGEINENKRI